MSILILFIISALPVVLLSIYIYKKDRNKEPLKLLIKLFLGGILSCFLVLFLSGILGAIFPILSAETSDLNLFELIIRVVIGIALIEEFSKWFFVYFFSYNNKEFDEIYDMIIYSVFVALGFAFFENILYVFQGGISTGIVRAILAVPGHAWDGVFMGYYLGIAKQSSINNNKKLSKKNIILSILVPTLLHGFYDYCLFTGNIIFLLAFLVFIILLYIHSIKRIKRMSSIRGKMRYKNNYCTNCGHPVNSNYCPKCGRKNE